MKSKILSKIFVVFAALGVSISLLANNSNELIESKTNTISTAIIKK